MRHPPSTVILTRGDLLAAGYSSRQLTHMVLDGRLLRPRRGLYALPQVAKSVIRSVRIGGLLGCVSAAAEMGVWVANGRRTHVWMPAHASRPRSPESSERAFTRRDRSGCTLHWSTLAHPWAATSHSVSAFDALIQIARCQPSDVAICAIDSALNGRLIGVDDLDEFFASLPERCHRLRAELDGRSMSGLETLVRLWCRRRGWAVQPQVEFVGIGFVDLIVNGCVVVETDGEEGHVGNEARDYDRDTQLVALGYTVLRFNYDQVVHRPDLVMIAIESALRMHRRGQLV